MSVSEKVTFLAMWNAQQHIQPALKVYRAPGTGFSYPVPAWTGDEVVLRFFHHLSDLVGPDTVYIGVPKRLLTQKYPSWEFVGVEETDFGLEPFEGVEFTLRPDERDARRPLLTRLEALYDEVMANAPEPPDRAKADELVGVLRQVAPQPLWPYYEVLLQDFDRWVDRR